MLIFKIIMFIVVGFIGFYVFLQSRSLDELYKKATDEEKTALEKTQFMSIILTIIALSIVAAL